MSGVLSPGLLALKDARTPNERRLAMEALQAEAVRDGLRRADAAALARAGERHEREGAG